MRTIDYSAPDYKRSRTAYTAQCALEYFISLLVADAFLAKLLASIGISDALIGIISSFISIAFVIQIMSIFLVRARMSRKKMVIIFDTLSQLFFCLIYFLPFLNIGKTAKTILIMLCILAAYAGYYLILSIYFDWANSYVNPRKRASFSATKEIISLASGIIFSAVLGMIIDRYESIGNLNGGFLFIAVSMLIINLCNFICLLMIKRDDTEQKPDSSFSEVLKHTLGNKNFRSIVILTILWECSRYFSIGFMGIFKTKDLQISVFAVQIINMAANIFRMAISKPFGRYSDKKSFAKGFELAMIIAAAGFFINIFTTQKSWYLIIAFTILYNVSLAGSNQNSFNIIYSYVDSQYITQAMAIKNSIGGILGFLASLAAGKLLNIIQSGDSTIFGLHIYAQQILSGISFLLAAAAAVYIERVIVNQKIKIQ